MGGALAVGSQAVAGTHELPDMPAEHRQTRFQPPPGSTELLLVRHGESAPFVPGDPFALKDGHGDPPLAPDGQWQAERVGERLASETIHAVYVTSLVRTHQTAAPLAARLGLVPIVEPGLREVFLGEWEGGVLRQRAAEQHPAYLKAQAEQEWAHIPGAESVAELTARCVAAVERIHARHPDERVAVFVHGGVVGALLAHATGARPFAFNGADNGSIHHLVVLDEEWRVRCFNDTSHLGGFTSRAQALT
jgi:probable phosphoglycerate mutase